MSTRKAAATTIEVKDLSPSDQAANGVTGGNDLGPDNVQKKHVASTAAPLQLTARNTVAA